MDALRAARLLQRSDLESDVANLRVEETWEDYLERRTSRKRGGKRRWKPGLRPEVAKARKLHEHYKHQAKPINRRRARQHTATLRQLRRQLVRIGYTIAGSSEKSEVLLRSDGCVEIRWGGENRPAGRGYGTILLSHDWQTIECKLPMCVLDWMCTQAYTLVNA